MKQMLVMAVGLCLALVSDASGQLVVGKTADEFGTIQQSGPRPATSGNRWWNIQGEANGAYASTGTLRFYLADAKAQFDAEYGPGGWEVDNVRLVLEHDDSGFTAPGPVDVYLFSDDTLAITNGQTADSPPGHFGGLGVSPLRFDAAANALKTRSTTTADPSAIFGDYVLVDTYDFSAEGDGDVDVLGDATNSVAVGGATTAAPTYSIPLPAFVGDNEPKLENELAFAGSTLDVAAINADLQSSDMLSLLFVPADPYTAATYKGNPYSGLYPPRIYIRAKAAAPPERLVIDDFSQGVIDETMADGDPAITGMQTGLATVLGEQREYRFDAEGSGIIADLTAAVHVPALRLEGAAAGPYQVATWLTYDGGGSLSADLTPYNAFCLTTQIQVSGDPAQGYFVVELTDGAGNTQSWSAIETYFQGEVVIPFGDTSGLDLTDIASIELTCGAEARDSDNHEFQLSVDEFTACMADVDPCPGDANGDGLVDGADFNILLSNWGSGTTFAEGDFTGDGTVDGADFNVLLSNWGACD